MINTFESLKVLKVEQISDLTASFSLSTGNSFHLLLSPKQGADKDCGELVTITAKPARNTSDVSVPITIGSWNPIIFTSIAASGIDLTMYDAFAAEVSNF